MEQRTFKHNKIEFNYFVIYSNKANINLTIKHGYVYIKIPPFIELKDLNNFLKKHAKKIDTSLSYFRANQKFYLNIENEIPGFIYLFNIKYVLKYHNFSTIVIDEKNQILFLPFEWKTTKDSELIKKQIYLILIKKYQKKLMSLIQKQELKLNIQIDNYHWKNLISQWGVCYPNKSNINLNIKLIHFSYNVINYVIVHELTHMFHHNHSQSFWAVVSKEVPNYKDIILKLKKVGL